MRTSLIALGLLSLGLAHCGGERGLLVGGERDGDAGEAGDMNTSGTGSGTTGSGGTANTGGTESSGGQNRGGTQSRGGSGAEGGEDSGTGGTGGTDRGGTDSGGTDSGGTDSGGSAGDVNRGGTSGSANAGMGGVAAQGGMDSGGRAGANTGGVGGSSDVDCAALAREYRERLAAAQECSPILTVEQCTRQMPDDLLCPCNTFVNPMREADVRRLQELIERARTCTRICPAIVCPDVRRGTCAADAIVGTGRGRCVAQP